MREQEWSLQDLFDTLDAQRKGFIGLLDFQLILGTRNKNYTMNDIEYLLRMYDKQGDRRITFEQFKYEIST